MMKTKNITLVALASALSFSALNGAINISSTFANDYAPGTFGDSGTFVTSFTVPLADLTAQSFSALGSDKLVLSISTKSDSSPGGAVSSLTYDGTAMTNVFQETFTRTQQELWYLDDVTSDGDIDLTFDAGIEGFGIYLWALDGTQAGGPQDTASEAAGDLTMPELTTSTGGAFVLWEVSGNRDSLNYSGSYSNAKTSFGGRGDSRALWNVEGAAGTFSESIDDDANGGGYVGAAFQAVPEPGSFALLAGMFGLTWVMLRRR